MTWTKLADGLPRHPKIVGLTDAAFRLHIYALCYASEQGTDGHISDAALKSIWPRKTARKLALELSYLGLWHELDHGCPRCNDVISGFYLHGFLDYNPSADEVEEARAKRSDKGRRAARARWDHAHDDAPSNATGMHQASPEHMLPDAPSRPVPTHSEFTSSSTDARGVPEAADDEEDPRYCTVLESRISKRMSGRDDIANPKAYRATVLAELLDEAGRTRKLLADFPTAPAQSIAGYLDGETSTLAAYRPRAEAS